MTAPIYVNLFGEPTDSGGDGMVGWIGGGISLLAGWIGWEKIKDSRRATDSVSLQHVLDQMMQFQRQVMSLTVELAASRADGDAMARQLEELHEQLTFLQVALDESKRDRASLHDQVAQITEQGRQSEAKYDELLRLTRQLVEQVESLGAEPVARPPGGEK